MIMKRNIVKMSVLLTTFICVTACKSFDEASPINTFSFNVTTLEDVAETRTELSITENRQQSILVSDDGHIFVATCEVGDMNGRNVEAETRATRYNSESEFVGQTFGIYGWDVSASNEVIFNNVAVSKSGTRWVPAVTKQWGPYHNYVFEAIYPKLPATLGSTGITSLTTGPNPGVLAFDYVRPDGVGCDADLMCAYHSGNCSDSNTTATLTFTHALTCVRFRAASGLTVNSVKLSGIYRSGHCQVAANGTYYTYSWTPSSATGDITLSTSPLSTDLLLIPQNLASAPVTLTGNITDAAGVSYNTTATLNTNNWLAGKVNTYTFSIDGESVQIGVNDNVTGKVKNNVVIRNNGTSKAYIRAAIEAVWVNDDGLVVAGWDPSSGSFSGLPGSKWVKVGDYYYYSDPVNAGAETPYKLFISYTAPVSSPVPGAHLEMQIFAQGVVWDADKARVKNAWGAATVSSAGLN